ncbi:methanol dehydrogenase [Morganella morganii]|uniref:Methanol dehydrogenase n=1 Tax=Morganella morganii TaxID=582 RepID=A0A433ZVL0_MORMO|nr:TPM domain-containing protein [Morganella morganii]RUT66146.1 methanol dehydrogenase [Morganella morganii]
MKNNINRFSHWLQGIFSLFLLLFAVTAVAQTETLPRMQGAVTDTAGLLTAAERSSIDQKLNALREQTGARIAVLTVKTTGSRDIESYAEKVFNHWRLGRINIDDGILLLVAADDRAMRIEVGYGLEGAVSDAAANRILNDYFIPNFKMGNYAGGINDTVDALIAKVRNEPLPPVTTPAFFIAKQAEPVGWIDIVLGAVLAASAYLWGAFLYGMVKRFKLKAAIPIAIILYLTWYAGGFNNPAGNGIHFGEDFLYTELPRWSQFLFLKILPFWLVIVLTFTMFIAVVFLFLLCLGGAIWLIGKVVKTQKMRMAIGFGAFGTLFGFIFGLSFGGNLVFALLCGGGFGLFMGIGNYLGIVKSGGGGGRGGRGGGGGGFRSSGGGYSGGGGASGRW